MSTSISNGYDTGSDTTGDTPIAEHEDGSVTYKAEASASWIASTSESFNINNKYSFNLSLLSVSVSAAVKDSSWAGASVGVAYGFPSKLGFIQPPKLKSKFKNFSTSYCKTYEYTNMINHRGESLSLRAYNAAIDQAPIAATEYGTQSIVFAGGDRIDLTASRAKSADAQSSMQKLKILTDAIAGGQAAMLAGSLFKVGSDGDAWYRGNATGGFVESLAISGGALALAIVPVLAMMRTSSKAPEYDQENLKGPNGSGTPNDMGILMDASTPNGGNFTVKGLDILFNATDLAGMSKSSLKFKKNNGSIEMTGEKKCSFETDVDGITGVFLDANSIKAKADQAQLSITGEAIELKMGDKSSVKVTTGAVTAGSLTITPGGVSLPNGTFTVSGILNVNP